MHSQEDIKKQIVTIEKQFPVEAWEINGVKVWPYLRIKLYIQLLIALKPKEQQEVKTQENNKETKVSKWRSVLNSVWSFFEYQRFLANLQSKQILFVGAHFQRVLMNERYFNRFFDSWISLYGLDEQQYTIEFLKVYTNSSHANGIIDLQKEIGNYKNVIKLKQFFKKDKAKLSSQLKDYDGFLQFLSENCKGISFQDFSRYSVERWVLKVQSIQPFFAAVFQKIQPKYLVFAGYYGYDDLYAAMLQANQMAITTVDFQHGPQTNIHMVFSDWTKFPADEKYDLMPREYWNWDSFSQQNIENWASKIASVKTKVVGQPFLAYWNQQNKEAITKKETIVYSLQTTPFQLEDLFPEELIRCIRSSSYQWILRLHPRSYFTKEEVMQFAVQQQFDSGISIQTSQDEPLPQVLAQAKFHVTNFSGCVIEAMMMGTPTVLIHPMGKEMFEQYIDNQMVFYLDRKNESFEVEILKLFQDNNEISNKELASVNPFE